MELTNEHIVTLAVARPFNTGVGWIGERGLPLKATLWRKQVDVLVEAGLLDGCGTLYRPSRKGWAVLRLIGESHIRLVRARVAMTSGYRDIDGLFAASTRAAVETRYVRHCERNRLDERRLAGELMYYPQFFTLYDSDTHALIERGLVWTYSDGFAYLTHYGRDLLERVISLGAM